MGILTAQKIAIYYERFKGIDVTFTKDMIQVTGLITEQVHLKCGSDFWPCVFYATSFQGAKIVANIKSGLLDKLQRANNMVSLRLCFKDTEKGNPLTFFVAGRVLGTAPYKNSEDIALLTIQYTQRPPDDLIEIVGRVLDANVNSSKRRDERIVLNNESQRKLKLLSKETVVFIQSVPRRCIMRDFSFSNAKLIMMGVAKFLVDKEITARFDFDDPRESFLIKGKFIRSENVEGKKELVALAMEFDETQIPMGFKIRLNEYLNTIRPDVHGGGGEGEESGVPAAEEHAAEDGEKK
ncbi:MAG: pilus assembly protein PilZ [Treponema sp.]|nr:pilus assembly protein PilZ [Treponema sp.]